jgi:hypothetical protein
MYNIIKSQVAFPIRWIFQTYQKHDIRISKKTKKFNVLIKHVCYENHVMLKKKKKHHEG